METNTLGDYLVNSFPLRALSTPDFSNELSKNEGSIMRINLSCEFQVVIQCATLNFACISNTRLRHCNILTLQQND